MNNIADNSQWVWERCECSANHTCLICATERAIALAEDMPPPQPEPKPTPILRYVVGGFVAAILLHVALMIAVNL